MRVDLTLVLVAAGPVLCIAGWLSLLALSVISGRHPIWNFEPRNLAEAVAFADPVAVARRLESGEDPTRPNAVRTGATREQTSEITAIEAAAERGDADMMRLLLKAVSTPEPALWQRAWCLSDEAGVRELLAARRPATAMEDCVAQ